MNESRAPQELCGVPEFVAAYLEGQSGSCEGVHIEESRVLAAALTSVITDARLAWPSLRVDAVSWARYLGAQAPPTATSEAWLATAPVSDLYLAFACASGESEAIALLEQRYFGEVRLALGRAGLVPSDVEEVLQQLRTRLFVGSGGAPPRILTYSGRGPLVGWLRVAAVRLAVAEHRRARSRPEAAMGMDVLERLASPTMQPESAYLRARYRVKYEHALKQALDTLSPQQRNLMRLYYVDGVGVEKLGRLHRVHASTVSRWLARARAMLLHETERVVRASIRMSEADFESLLRVVRSDLHVSLARFLP